MEKLPVKDSEFESDELRSQTIEEEFAKLKILFEQRSQEFLSEIEKLNQNEENKIPLSSKQIHALTQRASHGITGIFSSLNKEIKLRSVMGIPSKALKKNILEVDYKKFKSSQKTKTKLDLISSVIEFIESENLIVFGGPGLVLVLDAINLEKVAEITFAPNQFPVLFQYEPVTEMLFICCLNMLSVEAYKFDKNAKTFQKSYELTNHSNPGVASLKIIKNGTLLTGGYDQKLSVWNVAERKLNKEIMFGEGIFCFEEVSSSIILIGGVYNIIIFNNIENEIINKFPVHQQPIWILIYHAEFHLIISGSCDGTVKVSGYKDDGVYVLHTFQQTNFSYGVCLLDNKHILTCSKDRFLRVYDIVSGTKIQEKNDELQFDGDWIAIDTKTKRAFISETNGVVHIFEEKN